MIGWWWMEECMLDSDECSFDIWLDISMEAFNGWIVTFRYVIYAFSVNIVEMLQIFDRFGFERSKVSPQVKFGLYVKISKCLRHQKRLFWRTCSAFYFLRNLDTWTSCLVENFHAKPILNLFGKLEALKSSCLLEVFQVQIWSVNHLESSRQSSILTCWKKSEFKSWLYTIQKFWDIQDFYPAGKGHGLRKQTNDLGIELFSHIENQHYFDQREYEQH
jgi:hypothetical protein